jgi:uncharacterized protein (TIGR00255 family)
MLKSMTGFARQASQHDWGSLVWEIKTLNHRYLEQSIKLPEEMRGLEATVRERIAAFVKRGKVECQCRYLPRPGSGQHYEIDHLVAEQVMELHKQAVDMTQNTNPMPASELLAWPGVVKQAETDTDELHEQAMASLEQALQELHANREREGESLEKAIRERCSLLDDIIARLREQLPEIRAGLQERLRERLQSIDIEVDPGRLEQELVIQLQKMDVDEEMDRLQTHVNEVNKVLGRNEAIGRRLDFLMQELNREANTLGAKSVAVDTTNAAIDLKVLIEQMREQIQNIE